MADVAELGIKIDAKQVEAAGKKLASFGKTAALAGAATVAAFAAVIHKQMELIDQQSKLAKSLETTYASIANLKRAGDLGGVGVEQINMALKMLALNTGEAIKGSVAQAAAFKRLGIDAKELSQLPVDERILKINQALKENVAASERASVAADIFGAKNAILMKELDPETLREGARQAALFGQALTEIQAEQVERAGDAISTFGAAADGITKQLTAELSPVLEQLGNDFLDAVKEAGGMKQVAVDLKEGLIPVLGITADGAYMIYKAVALATHSFAGLALAAKGNWQILTLWDLKINNALQPWERNTDAGKARKAEIAALEKDIAGTENILQHSKDETERLLSEPWTKASDAMNAYIRNAEIASKVAAEQAVKEREAENARKKALEDRAKLEGKEPADPFGMLGATVGEDGTEEAKERLLYGMPYDEFLEGLRDKKQTAAEMERELTDLILEEQKRRQEEMLAAQHETLSAYGSLFDSLGGLYESFGKENSKTARVLFGISKAIAVADSMLAISAAAKALNDPAVTTLQRISNSAIIAAQVGAIVASVKSVQTPSGMAHDGIMSVPKTGTWLLEKGERVTTAETSAKMDRTLDAIANGGGKGSTKIINVLDSSLVADYLATDAGQEVVVNIMRRNQREFA